MRAPAKCTGRKTGLYPLGIFVELVGGHLGGKALQGGLRRRGGVFGVGDPVSGGHGRSRVQQMVCRLLAYNAELDLSRRLNAYLDDEDEYRAITRNLLHLGGTIAYRKRDITVSLDRPGSPRVERALREVVAELNDGPAVYLVGDRRPITYQVSEL